MRGARSLYSRGYFLGDCEGHRQFRASQGRVLSRRLRKVLALGGAAPGWKVLDIGAGRGELVLHCAARGARAVGIDLSGAALGIAVEARRTWARREGPRFPAGFAAADGCRLPFASAGFDLVYLSDIVEHLAAADLDRLLAETRRAVKPRGRVVIHTSPNRIFADWGLRLYWLLGRLYGIKLPWRMRRALPQGCRAEMHPNEQTAFSLNAALKRAGFQRRRIWLEKNPQYVYYFLKEDAFIPRLNRLSRLLPLKHLFYSELFAVASPE